MQKGWDCPLYILRGHRSEFAKARMKYMCGSCFIPTNFRVGSKGNYLILFKKQISSSSDLFFNNSLFRGQL